MLIVKIKCGLGNQLFQYAFARRLSLVNNVELKIDYISGNEHDPQGRVYSLKHFNINENLLTFDQTKQIQKKGRTCRRIIQILERRLKLYGLFDLLQLHLCRGCLFVNQRGSGFDKNIYNIKINRVVYLDGYWGSEKYFKDIEDIIRKEFTVKNEPDEENQYMINKILNSNSVCLHVRARRPGSFQNFAILPNEYYDKAVNIVTEKVNNPHFFIFSDDPEQARKTMNLSFPTTFVNINGIGKDYEDLRLMSLCKHYIIVNSTFSWWGAWLNTNPDKIVIAPKIWFADPVRNSKVKFEDLYPKEWIIL